MNVKLREKKLKNGRIRLFLAMWNPDIRYQATRGKRKGKWITGKCVYEPIDLYLTGDREKDKQIKRLAEKIRADKEWEFQVSGHGIIPESKKKGDFITYFEKFIEEKEFSIGSGYQGTLKHLKSFSSGSIKFKNINEKWMLGFKQFLETNFNQNSARKYFVLLKAVLKECIKDQYISFEAGFKLLSIKNPKKGDTERVYLTEDEVKKLAATNCRNKEIKKAFIFSCFTGLRISDIRNLTWGDIHNDGDSNKKIVFKQKKTKQFSYPRLSEPAKNLLFNSSDNIVHMPDQKIFKLPSRTYISRTIRKWCHDAGINKQITFHSARHFFATWLITKGADLYVVSKLLGHSDIKTTQIYAKVVDQRLNETVELLPDIQVKI